MNWQANLPTNARWRIISGFIQFVTVAGGVNREVGVDIISAGNLVYEWFSPQTVIPATAAALTYAPVFLAPFADPVRVLICIPKDVFLVGVAFIGSNTISMAGGDAYQGVNLLVEEWLDNV